MNGPRVVLAGFNGEGFIISYGRLDELYKSQSKYEIGSVGPHNN